VSWTARITPVREEKLNEKKGDRMVGKKGWGQDGKATSVVTARTRACCNETTTNRAIGLAEIQRFSSNFLTSRLLNPIKKCPDFRGSVTKIPWSR